MADKNKLEYEITATDKATPVLKGLSGTLSTVGGIAGGVFAAGATAAAAGIGMFSANIGEGLDALQRIERITSQTNAVIESTGGVAGFTSDEIVKMSKALEGATATEAESTQEAANMLLTFTNLGNDVFPGALQAVLDMSRALDKSGSPMLDMTSQAMMIGKALQDPIQGMGALKRVGVNFNDEAKKTVEAMVAMGDTAGAQKFILAELATEFGGSAEAFAQTSTGKLALVKDAFGNLQEALAGPFLAISGQVFDSLIQTLGDLEPQVSQIASVFGESMAQMLPILMEVGTSLLTNLLLPLIELGANLTTSLLPVFAQIMTAMAPLITMLADQFAVLLNELISALLPPLTELFPVIASVVGTLATAFVQLLTAVLPILDPFMTLIAAILPILAELLVGVIDAAMPLITTILGVFAELLTALVEAFMPLLQQILPPVIQLVLLLIQAIAPLLSAILPVLSSLISTLIQIVIPLVQLILPGFVVVVKLLAQAIQNMMPHIQNFSNWVQDRVIPAIRGIGNAIGPVIDWINRLASRLSSLSLPSWLTPGSPTPLELGLIGINRAAKSLALGGLPQMAVAMNLEGGPSLGRAPAAAGTTVVLEYKPTFSMADESELRMKLQPMLDKTIREYNRGTARR